MRLPKFRCKNKVGNWCFFTVLHNGNVDEENFDLETLSEFTGLLDKQGVEIYEGDIVKVIEDDEDSCCGRTFEYVGVASYGNSLKLSRYVPKYPTSFCLISKSFYMEQALLYNERWFEYEVIGNIYENSNLLGDNIEQN